MQVCEFIFTARFARGTKDAENNNFSIAAERTAMEKHSAAYAAETTKSIILRLQGANTGILLPEGLSRFAFRRPCPVECEAYSSGVSEKQKNQKLCALCASVVINFYKDPFRGGQLTSLRISLKQVILWIEK
jgi:hypothetical protein